MKNNDVHLRLKHLKRQTGFRNKVIVPEHSGDTLIVAGTFTSRSESEPSCYQKTESGSKYTALVY